MTKTRTAWMCCAALLLLPAGSGMAAGPQVVAQASDIDPAAMAAMDRMGESLRTHKVLDVKADITDEDVLEDGEKLQYAGTVEIQAQRPDRFKISAVSDLREREFYYDGKAVTVFSPRLGLYAAFPAPSTIRETLDKASRDYDIELPLADLFSWGMDKSLSARVRSAFLVRPEHIGGQLCDHYAFRQERVDWQIWIAQDASALPCKLVITDKTDPSLPQYTAVLHWNFPGSIPNDVFAFAPPVDAHKIVIARAGDVNKGARP